MILLRRKLNFSLLLLRIGFLFLIFLISKKIIVNSYEYGTIKVRHDKLILFLQNTRCKLHVKCIIYSSPYVLLTFFQSLLLLLVAHFIFLVGFVLSLFQILTISIILTICASFILILLIFCLFLFWRCSIIIVFIVIISFQIRFLDSNGCKVTILCIFSESLNKLRGHQTIGCVAIFDDLFHHFKRQIL